MTAEVGTPPRIHRRPCVKCPEDSELCRFAGPGAPFTSSRNCGRTLHSHYTESKTGPEYRCSSEPADHVLLVYRWPPSLSLRIQKLYAPPRALASCGAGSRAVLLRMYRDGAESGFFLARGSNWSGLRAAWQHADDGLLEEVSTAGSRARPRARRHMNPVR